MTDPRRPVMPDHADLELRVEPVIRCSRCGDRLPFGRIGRCDDCTGRGGNPIGCLVLAIVTVAATVFIAAAVLVGSSIARSEPGVKSPGASLAGSAQSGTEVRASAVGYDRYPDQVIIGAPPTYTVLGAMVEAQRLRGVATWFRTPGLTGAAGPVLRDALGDWRGEHVTVCASRCVTVALIDWCACGERGGEPTLIDLSDGAFARLADPSRGVIDVTIEVGRPRMTLPPTDSIP